MARPNRTCEKVCEQLNEQFQETMRDPDKTKAYALSKEAWNAASLHRIRAPVAPTAVIDYLNHTKLEAALTTMIEVFEREGETKGQ